MAVSRHVIAASKAVPACKIKGLFTFLKKRFLHVFVRSSFEEKKMCLFDHVILNSLGMRVSLASSSFQI
jgi:hypothetical protein